MNIAGCTLRAWKTAGAGSCALRRRRRGSPWESGVRGSYRMRGARGYRGAVSPFARVVAPPPRPQSPRWPSSSSRCRPIRVEGAAPAPKARKGALLDARSSVCGPTPRPSATPRRGTTLRETCPGEQRFARRDSVEARVGEAFAARPRNQVDRMNPGSRLHPDQAVVQLNLGVALFWSGLAGAQRRMARRRSADEPDSRLRRHRRQPPPPRVRRRASRSSSRPRRCRARATSSSPPPSSACSERGAQQSVPRSS